MPEPSAKVIADSISPDGIRLTSFEVVMHRSVLSEANTHRVFSRNSASSRAVPVARMLERFTDEWAMPVAWTSEQPGMQGGAELTGTDLVDAQMLLDNLHTHTAETIRSYIENHPDPSTRLHKSRINRTMEWGQFHTAIITATAYDNFFAQRVSPLAEPEIEAVASAMYDACLDSDPTPLSPGQWHLPYVDDETIAVADSEGLMEHPFDYQSLIKISVARCAAVSFFNQGKRDIGADLERYDKLTNASPMHASPLEHAATPEPFNMQSLHVRSHIDPDVSMTLVVPKYGNFLGWHQHRFDVEAAMNYQSFA